MVVIIEDVTDLQVAPPAEEPAPEPQGAGEADQAAPVAATESEEWVKVERGDAGGEDAPGSSSPEAQDVDPEEFAEQLAKAEALKTEGNRCFTEQDYDQAIDFYSQALEEAPPTAPLQRAVYFSNRAACHMRLEEHSEAAIDCSAALDLRPDYVKALVRRAAALEAMKNYEEALMDLRKALEAEPGNKAAEEGVKRMEPLAAAAAEVAKDEMIGKLKDLGNTLLGKFGMSLDNFKTEKDPDTGSYSIKFQQ